jgi:hypothetical protein
MKQADGRDENKGTEAGCLTVAAHPQMTGLGQYFLSSTPSRQAQDPTPGDSETSLQLGDAS